jgi:hypothetical protein
VSAMDGSGGRACGFQRLDLRVDMLQLVLVLEGDPHVEGHDGMEGGEFFVMLIQLGLDLRKLLIHRPTKISEILLNGLQDPQNHVIWFRHGTGSPVTPWFNLW